MYPTPGSTRFFSVSTPAGSHPNKTTLEFYNFI